MYSILILYFIFLELPEIIHDSFLVLQYIFVNLTLTKSLKGLKNKYANVKTFEIYFCYYYFVIIILNSRSRIIGSWQIFSFSFSFFFYLLKNGLPAMSATIFCQNTYKKYINAVNLKKVYFEMAIWILYIIFTLSKTSTQPYERSCLRWFKKPIYKTTNSGESYIFSPASL